jgi:predicted acyl esterase
MMSTRAATAGTTARLACFCTALVMSDAALGGGRAKAWTTIADPFAGEVQPFEYSEADIEVRRQVFLRARDGIRLAMDLYLPPASAKRPTLIMRTPYGRDRTDALILSLARHGYVVVAQDCRGTGQSEPGQWDMYMYEKEDSHDTVEWVTLQPWYNGRIGGLGGSYVGETQWFMSFHPAMTAIAPEVAGIGKARSNGVRLHLFVSAYARSIGKAGGASKSAAGIDAVERQMREETWATGYYNDSLEQPYPERVRERFPELALHEGEAVRQRMIEAYARMAPAERTSLVKFLINAPEINYANLSDVPPVFAGGGPAFKYVAPSTETVYRRLHAPALLLTGWYDWGLDYTLDTWEMIQRFAPAHVRNNTYLIVTPAAHADLGYREGADSDPALQKRYRGKDNLDVLLHWYDHWLKGRKGAHAALPRVSYYLMGSGQWRGSDSWPPGEGRRLCFYLDSDGHANGSDGSGTLRELPPQLVRSDTYVYDPDSPPPTTGGSIVSTLFPAGSTDQREVQRRRDVLVYTSAPLARDLAVVGPLRVVLFASSSAVDTDFTAKLSDVFPDGRALLIQSGIVRARFRNPGRPPSLITPGQVERYEIDLWATANLFRTGHCLRLEIASADFPRFERNANLGGQRGGPVKATQTVFHDPRRPSHLIVSVLPSS